MPTAIDAWPSPADSSSMPTKRKHASGLRALFVRLSRAELRWINDRAAAAGCSANIYARLQLGLPVYARHDAPTEGTHDATTDQAGSNQAGRTNGPRSPCPLSK